MLDPLAYPIEIINSNVADPWSRGPHVHKDQRNISILQILEQQIFHAESHDGNAVHAPLDHATDGGLHASRVVHGGGEKYFVVVLNRDGLENLHDLREKRVGDIGNDQAEDATASGDQRPRLSVRAGAKTAHAS